MTDHLTENARLRAALLVWEAAFLTRRNEPLETAYENGRAALAAPAPDAVQAATRPDRLADAAKTLLSVDEYGGRKEVYAACEGRVKVYKFDAALTRLSHARAPEAQYLPYGRHGARTAPEYRDFLNANFADMERRAVLAQIGELSDPYMLSLFSLMCQEWADEEGAHWLYSALTQIRESD